jgi:aldehyde:ferredoxin oxidoreductase
MNGWIGKLLRVDLSNSTYAVEDIDPDLAKDYVGGRGLAEKYLFD